MGLWGDGRSRWRAGTGLLHIRDGEKRAIFMRYLPTISHYSLLAEFSASASSQARKGMKHIRRLR